MLTSKTEDCVNVLHRWAQQSSAIVLWWMHMPKRNRLNNLSANWLVFFEWNLVHVLDRQRRRKSFWSKCFCWALHQTSSAPRFLLPRSVCHFSFGDDSLFICRATIYIHIRTCRCLSRILDTTTYNITFNTAVQKKKQDHMTLMYPVVFHKGVVRYCCDVLRLYYFNWLLGRNRQLPTGTSSLRSHLNAGGKLHFKMLTKESVNFLFGFPLEWWKFSCWCLGCLVEFNKSKQFSMLMSCNFHSNRY